MGAIGTAFELYQTMREEINKETESVNRLRNTYTGNNHITNEDMTYFSKKSEAILNVCSLPVNNNAHRQIGVVSDGKTIQSDISRKSDNTASYSPPSPPLSSACNSSFDSVSGCVSDTGSTSSSVDKTKKSTKKTTRKPKATK